MSTIDSKAQHASSTKVSEKIGPRPSLLASPVVKNILPFVSCTIFFIRYAHTDIMT